jgi:hypothetical protein
MGDKEEVAAFLPGRMFVNGTDNLLKFGKTPELLAAILDTQLDIKVSFVLKVHTCCCVRPELLIAVFIIQLDSR